MRVLFLHEVDYRRKPIFEMHEIPEGLSRLGVDVAFLDFQEDDHGSRGTIHFEEISGRVFDSVNLSLFSQSTRLRSVPGRLWAAFVFPLKFVWVLKQFQPDVVVSYAVPTSGWQALLICKSRGTPFVFRALDVSHKIRRTAFEPFVKLAEKYIYTNANWVSANNEALLGYCLSMGCSSSSSSVEYAPLQIQHFSKARIHRQRIRGRLGIASSSQVVLYMGSFFYFSGLEQVLTELAAKENASLTLLLVGGGEQELHLKRLAQDLGLGSRVVFTGYVDFRELPHYLAAADVAINPMQVSLVSNKAFPNKVIQYMAAGLPVVTTRLEGLESTFGSLPGLKFVESPSEILTASRSLISSSELESYGELNNLAVYELFDFERATVAFYSRLKRVVGDVA